MFSHADAFGNAPAHRLLDRVSVTTREPDTAREEHEFIPRRFSDYIISVDDDQLPTGVTMTKLIG